MTEIEDEPHLDGRRLTVRRIGALAEKRGLRPETIADRFDLTVADVHEALAFYHDHPDLLATLEAKRRERIGASRPDSLTPTDGRDDPAE